MAQTDYNGISRIYAFRDKDSDISFIRMEVSNTAGETNLVHIDPTSMTVSGSFIAGNIAHGSVSITPTANTPTSQSVSFGKTFPSTPNVIISAETSVPGSTVLECGATNISTTGFTAWVYRTNTTATVLHWIAIS